MKRKVRIFVVAIDEDPVPGAFDSDRIHDDIKRLLQDAIPHYNPQVIGLDTIVRESNFSKSVVVEYELPETAPIIFNYKAERSNE